MPLIEKRYAEALFEVGLKQNSVEIFLDELRTVSEIIIKNVQLNKFLNNLAIKSDDKKKVIDKLFKKHLNVNILNFLKLLIDKGRIKNFPTIVKYYSLLVDEIKKCLNIDVITSMEISKEQLKEIGEKYKKLYGYENVKVNHMIDPSIIGGVIVKIGDKMIDGSIRGKLNSILENIKESVR